MPETVEQALDKRFKSLEDNFASVTQQLADAQKNGATKAELTDLIQTVKDQGQLLKDYMDSQAEAKVKTIMQEFGEFLIANKSTLENIKKNRAGEIEFVPKVVGTITTGSGTDIDTPPLDVSTTLSENFGLRNDNALLGLCTVSSTSGPSFSYTEMTPKEGGYGFVLESGTKPQIDFKWENRYVAPKKIAAHEILTEEAVTDYRRLMSVAETYLRQQHDLFKVNAIYFADGTGNNPTGATVYGRTFVAGSMANFFAAGTSNFMDVVNAVITDIYTTQAYTNQAHFMPNIVMVNPMDFFKQLVAAKDGNGLPLYPQASLFNEVRIGGVVIKPWIKIPAGNIFVADMKKYNVVNYVPFSIRIGLINSQFITNEFTMVGESRFFQYVKNLDQAAFVYDSIATIVAAIEAP